MKFGFVAAASLAVLGTLGGCARTDSSAAAIAQAVAAHANTPAQRLNAIVEDYFERLLELDPLTATEIGDHRFDDRLPNSLGEAWLADSLALEQDALARLREIDPAKLD